MSAVSIIKALNDAAMETADPTLRKTLKDYALIIRNCIICLNDIADYEIMQELVGAWTRADRLLQRINKADPDPSGGAMPIPKQEAA